MREEVADDPREGGSPMQEKGAHAGLSFLVWPLWWAWDTTVIRAF